MNVGSLLSLGKRPPSLAPVEDNAFSALQRDIDRLFAEFNGRWPSPGSSSLTPRMDVTERDQEIVMTLELPGLEEKDVEVTLSEDILTVRGEKSAEKQEKDGERRVVERSYGAFARSLQLPPGVKPEDIVARMAKGVLTVTARKPAQPAARTDKIEVKAAV